MEGGVGLWYNRNGFSGSPDGNDKLKFLGENQMALFTSHFFANTLGMCSSAEVLLPDRPQRDRPIPTLYLLHGLSDDETIWMRRTAIELYAGGYYLAVVMPNGHRSFYSDMQNGSKYFQYITEELPTLMEGYFPLATDRENRFIAGLSMGGYGAFKVALNCPERYAAAAGLSSVADIRWAKNFPELFESIYGKDYEIDLPNDLFKAAEAVSHLSKEERPKLFQYCGTDDFLYEDNIRFRDHLKELGVEAHWEEGPGGHTWTNWDERIRNVLKWLPLSENVVKTDAIGI